MLAKIKSALKFQKGVYAEVKNDEDFSRNAWLIIILSSVLSALGSNTSLLREGRFGAWLLGMLGSAIFSVVGFVLACVVITRISGYFFNINARYEEVLRPLGLARVWFGFTFIGILTAFAPALACITGPVGLVAVCLGFFAWWMAIKETMQLEWPQSLALIIIGVMVMVGISIIINIILASLGLVSPSFMDIFQ